MGEGSQKGYNFPNVHIWLFEVTSDLKDLLWAVKKLIMEANVHKCALWGRRLRKKHCLASVIPLILGEEKKSQVVLFWCHRRVAPSRSAADEVQLMLVGPRPNTSAAATATRPRLVSCEAICVWEQPRKSPITRSTDLSLQHLLFLSWAIQEYTSNAQTCEGKYEEGRSI